MNITSPGASKVFRIFRGFPKKYRHGTYQISQQKSRLMWPNSTSISSLPTLFKHVRALTDVWCSIHSVRHKCWLIYGNTNMMHAHVQVILKSINSDVFQVVTACVIIYANLKENKSKWIYLDTCVYGPRHLFWGLRYPVCRRVDDLAIGHPCIFYFVLYREEKYVA